MGVFNQFLISERFTIPVAIEDVDKKLLFAEGLDFDIEGGGQYSYRYSEQRTGFGYGNTYSYNNVLGISIITDFSDIDKHLTEVFLYTNLNWSLVFLAILEAVVLIAVVCSASAVPWQIYIIMPLSLVAAWFVMRVREYLLMIRVKRYLTTI